MYNQYTLLFFAQPFSILDLKLAACWSMRKYRPFIACTRRYRWQAGDLREKKGEKLPNIFYGLKRLKIS